MHCLKRLPAARTYVIYLRSHATMIMMTLDSWIENLDDLDLVVDAVLRVGQTHAGMITKKTGKYCIFIICSELKSIVKV